MNTKHEIKGNNMSNVIYLIFDSIESAREAKKVFKGDYSLYISYLSQFKNCDDGMLCKIIPVSKNKYLTIDILNNN